MITLTIYCADGSVHWTEYFNDLPSAQAWIGRAQSQCNWDKTFTYAIQQDIPVAPTADQLWDQLRDKRDELLMLCDWTQLMDSPLTADGKEAWTAYRQALRDLPKNTTDPSQPVWPTAPA